MKLENIRYELKCGEFHELAKELKNMGYKVKQEVKGQYSNFKITRDRRQSGEADTFPLFNVDGDENYRTYPRTSRIGKCIYLNINPNTILSTFMSMKDYKEVARFYKLTKNENEKVLAKTKNQNLETQEQDHGLDFYDPCALGTYDKVRSEINAYEKFSTIRRKKGLFVRLLGHLSREGLMVVQGTKLEKIVQELK